jgi:hypothetical protein
MYAQQDMTDEEREHIRIISSPEYQAGYVQGYKVALAVHGIVEAAQ